MTDPFVRAVEAVLFAQQEEPRPASRVFPAPAGYGTFPDRTDQVRDLERALHEAVVAGLPEGWQRAEVTCTALGTRVEVTAAVTTDAPLRAELTAWTRRARAAGLDKDDVSALFTDVLDSTFKGDQDS